MTTELVNPKTGEIAELSAFTPEQTELLKRTVAKDFSNDEFLIFLNVCKKVQLDPFSKQIYAIKYGGRMTIQTSIDGLRLVADRSGNYAPGRAPSFTYKKDGSIESATAYIQKLVRGQWFEVASTAFMDEYVNPVNALWKKLPHAMLAKCAESQALRRAFPNETSGLYTTEEMSQAERGPTVKMPTEKPIEIKEEILTKAEIVDEAPWDNMGDKAQPEIEFPDPEFKNPSPVPEAKSPSKFFKKMHAVAREKNLNPEHVKAAIKILFNKSSSKDLTDDECSTLIVQMEKGAVRGA